VDHVTALPCLLLGLEGFRVVTATTHGHELVLLVETTTDRDVCRTCGVRASSKGRARTTVRDVPIAGRPTVLVWRKRIWRCEQPECDGGSWRETTSVVRPRAVLTERARAWAVRQVGRDALSVAQVARELGWHTIMAAVVELGGRLLADDDRLERVVALGLESTTSCVAAIGPRPRG
jgi:transposase